MIRQVGRQVGGCVVVKLNKHDQKKQKQKHDLGR